MHGERDGVRIDTPDVSFDPKGWKPGEDNVGMPYCWGGFTSLAEFEEQLAQPLFAGHVPLRGNARGSNNTVGVDCSGYVSRCWGLPTKQSTRSLGKLCYELDDYSELLPGDIVNRFDAHVVLFAGWANDERTAMNVLEAARLRVKRSTYTVDKLRKNNFRPMRYKLLDERWQPMPEPSPDADTLIPLDAPREFVASTGQPQTTSTEPSVDPLPDALRAGATRAGDWARYGNGELHTTWMAVGHSADDQLELQQQLSISGELVATGSALAHATPWAEVLAKFGNFPNPAPRLRSRVEQTRDRRLSRRDPRAARTPRNRVSPRQHALAEHALSGRTRGPLRPSRTTSRCSASARRASSSR